MAVYQFTVVLLPKQWVSNSKNKIDSLYSSEGYDVSEAWQEYQPSKELITLLSSILPKGKAWHTDLEVWGDEEYSYIQVWRDKGVIESISIRLDLRENITPLLSKVVELAEQLDCVLFIPSSKVIILPNVFELNKIAANSNAAKYAKDPEAFLNGLKSDN